MDIMLDEQAADKAVIASLLKASRLLWQQLETERNHMVVLKEQIKRSPKMSKLIQDENGILLVAHEFEAISIDKAEELLGSFEREIELLKKYLAAHRPTSTPEPTPLAPVEQPVAPVETPPAPAPIEQVTPPMPINPVPAAPVFPTQPVAPMPQFQTLPAPQIDPATGMLLAAPTPAPIVEPQPLQ